MPKQTSVDTRLVRISDLTHRKLLIMQGFLNAHSMGQLVEDLVGQHYKMHGLPEPAPAHEEHAKASSPSSLNARSTATEGDR